jgi:hypothetical protein
MIKSERLARPVTRGVRPTGRVVSLIFYQLQTRWLGIEARAIYV